MVRSRSSLPPPKSPRRPDNNQPSVDASPWKNRIVGYGNANPETLVANPLNWRIHPEFQQHAMVEALETLGWIQDIIINKRTDKGWGADQGMETVLDGHLRITLALQHHIASVPVKYVDLSPNEERLALSTLDPLTGMALADETLLKILTPQVTVETPALTQLLQSLAALEPLVQNLPLEQITAQDIPLLARLTLLCPPNQIAHIRAALQAYCQEHFPDVQWPEP